MEAKENEHLAEFKRKRAEFKVCVSELNGRVHETNRLLTSREWDFQQRMDEFSKKNVDLDLRLADLSKKEIDDRVK
ncbi:hypothetical protein LINPERHAP1_LOCUS23270 [Linum perenne]